MTKAELVTKIAKETGADPKEILLVVECLMNSIKTSLSEGKNVYFRGFGSSIVKKRAAKMARNISENTTMLIPAHNVPVFKPSKDFQLNPTDKKE